MRIALVQLAMAGRSRAADIQHLARTMDRALRTAPPTDLVVLPGACDTAVRVANVALPVDDGQYPAVPSVLRDRIRK